MPEERDNPIKQEKTRKRKELLSRGLNPYPHKIKPDLQKHSKQTKTSITQIIKNFDDLSNEKKLVSIAGRLMRKRPMGKAAFFNIQDERGELQCYIRRDDFPENSEESFSTASGDRDTSSSVKTSVDKNLKQESDFRKTANKGSPLNPWELWKLCDIGDIVALSGRLFNTQKGEKSLRVEDFQILCKTLEALPEKYHGLEDKELKYRYRHLDLIMDLKSREIFKIRSKVIQEIRSFMSKKGFMEVEIPVLQPIYGGAVAAPFETYFRRLNQKMYLKISPEIYLKKLIVGGFEKVFEIGKNFRNEGIDRSHNPEFTMMEYYEAYTDYEDQMRQFEELICYVTKKIKGSLKFEYQGRELDFTRPWIQISLREFEDMFYHKINVGDVFTFKHQGKEWNCDQFFEEINKDIQNRKKINKLNFKKFWKEFSLDKQEKKSTIKNRKLTKKEKSGALLNDCRLALDYLRFMDPKGDFDKFDKLLRQSEYLSDPKLENVKNELSLMALEQTVEKYFWNPVFITDFPLETSPLTKKHRNKKYPQLVERFEPYIAGMEMGNAYTELNDPVDQRQRLEEQRRHSDNFQKEGGKKVGKDFNLPEKTNMTQAFSEERDEENLSHPVDENFLHALEIGMPPTGGVGLGIERLVMILTDQNSIRDSILFPVLRDKSK